MIFILLLNNSLCSFVSVTEQRLMKINPTKMIENEIQWLLNFECGTNLGKVLFCCLRLIMNLVSHYFCLCKLQHCFFSPLQTMNFHS